MNIGTRVKVKEGVGSSIGHKLIYGGISIYGEGVIIDYPMSEKVRLEGEVCVLLDGHDGGLIFTKDELEIL